MTSLKNKTRLAVLVHDGGTHTNLKAIQNAIQNERVGAEITIVVSDNEDVVAKLEKSPVDYICLAGWKQIIPDTIIEQYQNKILNIHPGLIPDTKDGQVANPDGTKALWNQSMYGNKAIHNFLDQKATYAGASIHFLTNDFDFGPVLGRTFEEIKPNDTPESLYARLKVKENELYVEVLEKLCNQS